MNTATAEKYDLVKFNVYTGKVLSFIVQDKTDDEIEAHRERFFRLLPESQRDSRGCSQEVTGTVSIGDTLELDWLKPIQHKYKMQPGAAFDILGVLVENSRVRVLDIEKTADNAEAWIALAVARRGCSDEFFVAVPSQSHKDGDTYKCHAKKLNRTK